MKDHLRDLLIRALDSLRADGTLPAELPIAAPVIDRTKSREHGDFASNLAMTLAKPGNHI